MNELGNSPADKNYKPSGISKEEQLCSACCPHYGKTPDQCGYTERKMQWDCPYFDFIERGYETAEKDLALTIKDLELLHTFLYAVKNNKHGVFTFTRLTDEQYQEVLKRYLEAKK